jgi:hypothetical protein
VLTVKKRGILLPYSATKSTSEGTRYSGEENAQSDGLIKPAGMICEWSQVIEVP